MSYNAANQMQSMSSQNGSIAYTYDENGNMTGKMLDGDKQDSYTYDVSGNLTQYKGYDGYIVDYSYSALDMLTEKVSTGNGDRATLEEIVSGKSEQKTASSDDANSETVTTKYTYDILQTYYNVLTETTDGALTQYEYGLERIAAYTATTAEAVKMQYVYDVRGSVIQTLSSKVSIHIAEATAAPTATLPLPTAAMPTATGISPTVVTQSYAYTPFGEQIGNAVSGYTYNGEAYDAATGMLNLRARQYEPAQMRFSQQDIVRGYAFNPQTANRYVYCINNPMGYADPSGMIFESLKNINVGEWFDKNIVQPVKKTVSTFVSGVKTVVRKIVKEYKKRSDAASIREMARDRGMTVEEFKYQCTAILDQYVDAGDAVDVIVYINELGGLPRSHATKINEIVEEKGLSSAGLLREYEDLSTEKPNQTLLESFFDWLFPTGYCPGYSYVKVVPDEAFFPVEINSITDWAKYNIVLPMEQMAAEDWKNYWAANAARYEAYCKEGGFYNTLNYWTCGIPDAAVAIYRANGYRGQAAWNDPNVYNIANYLTMGLVGQFSTASSTPISDPDYWRALRNILMTEAGAIAIYNGIASGATLPTTTEGLIEWGNRMGAPQGSVPAGTFDEAFENPGWEMPETGKYINGRWYSQHALERMAPNTPEVQAELYERATKRASELGYFPGTREYSQYVDKYCDPRGIPPMVIEDAIENGTRSIGNDIGTFVYETNDVTVVLNQDGAVITVVPK